MRLDGSWEGRGRNPLVAAVFLVAGLGALYMLVQALVLNGWILLDLLRAGGHRPAGGGAALLEAMAGQYRRYRPLILGVLVATQFLIFLGPALLAVRRWHTAGVGAYLGLRRFPAAALPLSLAGIALLLVAVAWLDGWLFSFFPALARWNEASQALFIDPRPGPLAATLLAIAVTPAICEEVLFRGYFQGTLERRLRSPWPFLVSGAVFALFHQRVLGLPSLLLVGLYLGWVFHRFGALWLTMLCHLLYNALILLAVNFPSRVPAVLGAGLAPGWPAAAGAALLLAAAVWGLARLRPAPAAE